MAVNRASVLKWRTRQVSSQGGTRTDTKLAAEVVKLKQEVAELRATIQYLAEYIGATSTITQTAETLEALKPLDDGWGHAEDGWPWDVTELGCICEEAMESVTLGLEERWLCPAHGYVLTGTNGTDFTLG